MRSYPLRLKDELADAARAHADRLGISFNALVAVALDAYLHGDPGPSKPAPRRPPAPRSKPAKPAMLADPDPSWPAPYRHHPDPANWRNFHQPEFWPWRDPDWIPPDGIRDPYSAPGITDLDDVSPEVVRAFEDAYWRDNKRPPSLIVSESDITH